MKRIALALLLTFFATVASAQDAQEDRASRALDAFLGTYWDPGARLFFAQSDHQPNPGHTGERAEFWWVPHLWETVIDAYERTGKHRELVDEIYDGFVAGHPDWANDFDDDLGWWALACMRAFEVTHEVRFRERATALWEAIAAFEDSTYGGGVWWMRNGGNPQKGLPISAPLVMTAVRLFESTRDRHYLEVAEREYDWLERTFVHEGHVNDHIEGPGAGTVIEWQLTYDYGTWIGASLSLWDATHDARYLANAVAAADVATTALAPGGVLQNENDDDGAGFKMILTRNLVRLVQHGFPSYARFLEQNADAAWSHRRADGLMGTDWASPAPSGAIQSFAAGGAVAVQFHALPVLRSRLELVRPARVEHAVVLEASGATLSGVGLETSGGRTYVAGWNGGGEASFDVDVREGGAFELVFRYSAGAGDATRTVSVNGASSAVTFRGTPSWGDGRACVLRPVTLVAGKNTIIVAFDGGSANWLNLERVVVALDPAR